MRARHYGRRVFSLVLVGALVVPALLGAPLRSEAAAVVRVDPHGGVAPVRPDAAGNVAQSVPGVTTLISQSGGVQGNGDSFYPAVSGDGRYVAFESTSSNLVAGDTNASNDVFVYDRTDGSIERVSISTSGVEGTEDSFAVSISDDGRYIAFASFATNLADGITTPIGESQIYLHDRTAGTTTLVSGGLTGSGGNNWSGLLQTAIAGDGSIVAYDSFANDLVVTDTNGANSDIFVWDRASGTTTIVSVSSAGAQGNDDSYEPSVSSDGRYVAFGSYATNLIAGGTNDRGHIFVRDRANGTTIIASISTNGVQGDGESRWPAISADGRIVTFESIASNLSPEPRGFATRNVYARDLVGGATWRVSLNPAGETPGGNSDWAAVSSDGRRIAFSSAGDFGPAAVRDQIYVLDSLTGEIALVSVNANGESGNSWSENPALSGDGLVTAFSSRATNLVSPPTSRSQIFINVQPAAAVAYGSGFPEANGSCAQCAYSKDPVNLGTGSFATQATDLAMPGRVLGLAFTRWYNSADPRVGPLGPGWTHSYNWKVTDRGSVVYVRRGDGRRDTFTRNADATYAGPPSVFDVLTKNGNGTYTLTLTSQIKYEFSSVGRLTRIHEPSGNELSFTYTSGKLTRITDTAFRDVSLSYDSLFRLTQIQDPLGRQVTYAYESAGRLATVTDKIGNTVGQDPLQHQWKYAYEGTTSWLTTVTDPDGRARVTNTYDAQGRINEQRDGLSEPTTISYGTLETTVTDPRGHSTTYAFDDRLRVLTQADVVDGQTLTISYTYDAAGNRITATDREGNTTDLAYDARGNVLTKTDPSPDGLAPRPVTTFDYDAKNNLVQITDAIGAVTTLTYDPATNVLGTVIRQVDATTTATTSYEYGDPDNPGLPTRVYSPLGNAGGTPDPTFSTALAYDIEGNLVSRTDPDGAVTTFQYDDVGRLVSFVDAEGNAPGGVASQHSWTVAYDENDRETARTDPLGNALRYAYDGAGDRTSLIDRNGNVTAYGYDANARLTTVRQLANTTTVTRDANGNATRITQANGVVTDYGFDALDRLTSVTTHPAPGIDLVTSYVLDGNGQPTSRTTGDGVTVTYGYDALARLVSVSGPSLSIAYGYDAVGRRIRMTDVGGATTYQYDDLGRVMEVSSPLGTVGYDYDLDGNRILLLYPGGDPVSYSYSPGGRLETVTDWAGRTSTYAYLPSGLVRELTYPNDLVATYAYDPAQRLTDLQYTAVAGAVTVAAQHFTLDPEGNRLSLQESATIQLGGVPVAATDTFTMAYDGLNRLTTLAGARFVGAPTSETFIYDGATNIVARTGPAAAYTHDGANRVTSDGAQAFTWDGADRLIQRGVDVFTYDALSRLTAATVAGAPVTYAYDGDGLLSARTDGSGTTSFVWDTSAAPASLLEAGTDRVVHGLGPLYLARADGSTIRLLRDALGSVRAEVNDLGVVTKAFRYAAYGAISDRFPSAATPTLLGFTGELSDSSRLNYLRARWYDSGSGRFATRDAFPGTLAVPSSLNPFNYAHANPVVRIDPTGLATGSICITASFGAGGFGSYQICPIVVSSAGEVGWAATLGAGLSPSLSATGALGLQGSNAEQIRDLAGPFTQAGGSAGEGLVAGTDWFWSDDLRVQGGSAQVGLGVRLTGVSPVEVHVVRTDTHAGVFFNIFDLFRTIFRMADGKATCGC